MSRVIIATPVRDRAWFLPTWFAHLSRAAQQAVDAGEQIRFLFLENDSGDDTLRMVKAFADLWPGSKVLKHDIGYAHYKVPTRDRKSAAVDPHSDKRELAWLRNRIVKEALAMGCDDLVMWDSDILMPLETLSAHPRSLLSVLRSHPRVGMLAVDVEHPAGRGRYHNYMIQAANGIYNHPDRRSVWVPSSMILDQFIFDARGRYLRPAQHVSQRWDARDPYMLLSVGMTGAASVIRAQMFRGRVQARYGAHEQGEEIPLCERIREKGHEVAVYTGLRGLHMSLERFAGDFDLGNPWGEWINVWDKSRVRVPV